MSDLLSCDPQRGFKGDEDRIEANSSTCPLLYPIHPPTLPGAHMRACRMGNDERLLSQRSFTHK